MLPDFVRRSGKGYAGFPVQLSAIPPYLQPGVLVLLLVSLTILETTPVTAGGVVNPCTDANLRAALNGGGTVTFDCDGMIVLTNTLVVDHDSVLDGTGRNVIISGNKSVRLFQVNTGIMFTARNLTMANGMHQGLKNNTFGGPGSNGFGAGILNLGGTVTLINCTLSGHVVQGSDGFPNLGGQGQGAALCNLGGEVNLTNCVLAGNFAKGGFGYTSIGFNGIAGGGYGGALYTDGGGVGVYGCTFTTNTAVGGEAGSFPYDAAAGPGQGGALYATSSVLQIRMTLFNSNACRAGSTSWSGFGGFARGGALAIASGSAQVSDSAFLSNLAVGGPVVRLGVGGEASGGGMDSAGELLVLNTRVSSNVVIGGRAVFNPGRGLGGGISARGPLSTSNCAFDGNEAQGGGGAEVIQSCFAGTNGCGGAIYTEFDLRATNITVFANRALGGDARCPDFIDPKSGAPAQGGGICISTGSAVLVNATIYGNIARGGAPASTNRTNLGPAQGGGIALLAGTAALYNSILASNTSGSNCFGMILDGGNNISSDASCPFPQPGSLTNADPKLGPFADYGGPTPTMPLLASSSAIDAASPTACPPVDQRGIARPYGAGCDIGAFESAPPYTIHGHVRGYLSSNGTTISAGRTSTNADSTGFFAINSLAPGAYTVTPSAQDSVFVLSNQVLNVGPDIVNADFRSYRSNAWTVVGVSNSGLQMVLAGAAGQTYQIFDSTNLTQWSPFTNGLMPSSSILLLDQPADRKSRFFYSPGP